ncbi:uncharacterized protein H6S33_003723 [Morchella sextelata]|uniref:uncharacterized protein n=1 Tax=Morchella sextelata TaxID=1174677 RepID=UPI001D03E04B|nr:uncharacterized protein H6S33_003723 [Morchella sextelata]KAH0606889.1 hypothetical protein H6S33_003723 [Morchella sextelata]
MARRGRDERWPHAAIITLRTFQLIFAALNPLFSAMFGSGFFLYLFALGITTIIYIITCLICYCCGKMHPLSLAIIDFIGCFLWAFGVASAGYGWYGDGYGYGGGSGLLTVAVALIELFFFIATTVIAGLVVRADRKKAKRAAAVVSVSVVPGRVEAAA